MKEQVEATIDSNEASQNPELVTILTMHEDVEDYKIEPLSEGDFIIGECMFERKTPSDFASSLEEGRLRDQVERMAGTDYQPYILIEGDMKDFENLQHTNMPAKSLRGMDASIEQKNQVGVKYCSKPANVADMGVRLARKKKEGVDVVQARQTEAIKDASFIEQVFLSIEGVGVKTAEKLASQFPSLEIALEANISDFERVENVGSTRAEEIHQTLHSEDSVDSKPDETESRVYTV